MNKPKLVEIYDQYVDLENEKNRLDRYEGNEKWFNGSASGLCIRKNYYKVNGTEVSNPRNRTTNRLLRLGTVLHNDFQNITDLFTLIDYKGDIGGSTINSSLYSTIIELTSGIANLEIEGEIQLPEYNVRGFYDIVVTMETGEVFLYDIKTMSSWSWKYKFNNTIEPKASWWHELQLATYGIGVQKKFGRLDGMSCLYYNKDSSVMKECEVDLDRIIDAKGYWANNLEQTSLGRPPELITNESPAFDWECKYCDFQDYCKNDWEYD